MAMRAGIRVYCEQCDAEGPEADAAPEARELAEMAGWWVGRRDSELPGRAPDYCPQCKQGRESICAYGGGCRSDALYQYGLQDGREVSACGKHFSAILRDVFAQCGDDSEIKIRKLRGSRRDGSRAFVVTSL